MAEQHQIEEWGEVEAGHDLDAADRAACAAVYAAAEHAVKASVAHLLDRRRDDAYDRAVPRLARELATGQTAPTFPV